MPGIRYPGMPTPTLLGTGERPAVTIRSKTEVTATPISQKPLPHIPAPRRHQ
jgi:hypothetical protein